MADLDALLSKALDLMDKTDSFEHNDANQMTDLDEIFQNLTESGYATVYILFDVWMQYQHNIV